MKIALGMSGGVDSTISAYLLKEMGYEVVGITMAKWNEKSGILTKDKRGCYGPSEPLALNKAKETAKKLGIEHHIIRLDEEFEELVLKYYTETYLEGRTPNPCVLCNRFIKFGALLDKAKAMGISFDKFATGHYAINRYNEKLKRWQLQKGRDKDKDQSYFLAMLTQEQLSKAIFPLGEMLKSEIREIAKGLGIAHLIKDKESQDFLESYDHSPLFKGHKSLGGELVDTEGQVLGKHKGLMHYTIGQRKGIGLAGFDSPRYVVGIDKAKNRVIIGRKEDLFQSYLYANYVNWVSIAKPDEPLKCSAKIRQAQEPAPCTITKEEGRFKVIFDEPIAAITGGQLVAFYAEDLLLGAGIIDKA